MSVPWGAYSASIDYVLADGVSYNGGGYTCLLPNGPSTSIHAPTDTTYWKPTPITRIDWTTRLLGRIYQQFVGAPNIEAIVRAKAAQYQAIEDALHQLLTLPSIDDSYGAQLDNLGRILDMARGGATDASYRLYLKAKARALRSTGTAESIYKTFRALLGNNSASLIVSRVGIAALTLTVLEVMTSTMATVGLYMLRIAKMAGVRAWLLWQQNVDSEMFIFDTSTNLSQQELIGVTTLHVYSTAAFPSSGSLILGYSGTDQETVTYAGKTGTTFTGVSATTNLHELNTCVSLVGTTGKGMGDSTDASVGGELSGAAY